MNEGLIPISKCVIEDAIEALAFIGAMGRIPIVKTSMRVKPLEERITISQVEDFEETSPEIAWKVKFQQERLYLQVILKKTAEELEEKKSWSYLRKKIMENRRKVQEEESLLKEAKENGEKVASLKRMIFQEEVAFRQAIQNSAETIGLLKDTIEV